MNERPIPEAAFRDKNAVEMLRVWIAERKLHCSMKVGMYEEATKVAEEKAWGTILADVTRHLANALADCYGRNRYETINAIRTQYLSELNSPTSKAEGRFAEQRDGEVDH